MLPGTRGGIAKVPGRGLIRRVCLGGKTRLWGDEVPFSIVFSGYSNYPLVHSQSLFPHECSTRIR